jgi:hypothetical protein
MNTRKINRVILLFYTILVFSYQVNAQWHCLPEQPGKFIIHNNLIQCPALDKAALAKNITGVTGWLHQNDLVFNPIKGFDANISLFGNTCDQDALSFKEEYGTSCRISIVFNYFYTENGVNHTADGWSAPGIEIQINNPLMNLGNSLGDRGFKSGDDPVYEQSLNTAYENLQKIYAVSIIDKEIAPGVRLFQGGQLIISKPERPDYLMPVPVQEVMIALMKYWKIRKEMDAAKIDKVKAEATKMGIKMDDNGNDNSVYDLIVKEFEGFTAEELKSQAYRSSDDGISGINTRGNGTKIIKFNPESWDRTQPKTAVQFISMKYKYSSKTELNEFLHDNNQLPDFVGLFLNNMQVEKLGELLH